MVVKGAEEALWCSKRRVVANFDVHFVAGII